MTEWTKTNTSIVMATMWLRITELKWIKPGVKKFCVRVSQPDSKIKITLLSNTLQNFKSFKTLMVKACQSFLIKKIRIMTLSFMKEILWPDIIPFVSLLLLLIIF